MDLWCEAAALDKGQVISPDQAWRLAMRWYSDRLEMDWRRKSVEEAEATFADVGLRGDFWKLEEEDHGG